MRRILFLISAMYINSLKINALHEHLEPLHWLQGARLAPLYDLLATVAYPDLSSKLAMEIGRCATLSQMDAKGWAAFATDAGLGLPLIRRRVVEISDSVKAAAQDVAHALVRPGLDEAALAQFADLARERAERCALTVQKKEA
jgi:serine/threonine-protein kinase HipA